LPNLILWFNVSLKKPENILLLAVVNSTLKFVSMILKLNLPILKSSKLTLLLLSKKPLPKNLAKYVWPNPPINTIDFMLKLLPSKKVLPKMSKKELVDLKLILKKDPDIYKILMDGTKMIP